MREMTFDEVKQVELKILIDIANFCEKNGIQYFLAYGTLIGAVRHKGFIPWDDDIDLWMTRHDYEKFIASYNSEHNRYCVISPYDEVARHSMVKVVDTQTIKIETGVDYKNGHLGIDVDIFPLDGEPDDEQMFVKWYEKLMKHYQKFSCFISLPDNNRKTFLFTHLYQLLGLKKTSVLDKTAKLHSLYPYAQSRYVGSVECSVSSPNERFCREWFSASTMCDFEGHQFKIPIGYDQILTQRYGDYMQMPPEEERVTHHSNRCYWIKDIKTGEKL